jgi:CheY-like chemotaxis protein
MIVAAAQSGSELTHRLLAFARKQTLAPMVILVDSLVDGIDGLLRRALGGQVELHVRHAGDVHPAYIDAAQLENALLNLCINSRDAMPDGGTLSIETSNVELDQDCAAHNPDLRAGHYVKLTISDTGTGIPAEHLEHIFEPFFTTKEQGKGTGLGMSMVYGFIKQSGGHISLTSAIAQGTSIDLFLPAAPDAQVESSIASQAANFEGGSEHVLLVEDDESVRRFAFDQLIRLGYRVTQASGPSEALTLLASDQRFDLLLTDVVMPEMSGRVLADKARELRPRLAVLFTSGYTQDAVIRKDEGHPELLLGKPYRRAELARKVREALAVAKN